MASKLENFSKLFAAYKKWVSSNPQLVSDVETTAKWVSYFVAGRISSSSIVSELIYSLSNILVLFNDRIIEKAHSIEWHRESGDKIRIFLTTLEYCEVFLELSSRRLWGEKGKWLLIVTVQVIKCIGRYLLFKKYSEAIIRTPTIPALNRRRLEEIEAKQTGDDFSGAQSAFYFKLKRSGRVIRKIEGAPPLHLRDWKSVDSELSTHSSNSSIFNRAETLYILKPLIHLGAIRAFGYKSWKSYGVALLCDIMSIKTYYENRHLLSKRQKLELSRRCVMLLLYLMRSPFYEKSTENKLMLLLYAVSYKIPLTKIICNPLIQYIPHWQNTYFYMWST